MSQDYGSRVNDSAEDRSAEMPVHPLLQHFRPLSFVLFLGVGLCFAAFFMIRNYEDRREQEAFAVLAQRPAQELERQADRVLEVLLSVGHFYAASQRVQQNEFREFVSGLLQRHPEIQALEWVPRIHHAARQAFEQTNTIPMVERTATGEMVPAEAASEYFPIRFLEPYMQNEQVMGMNYAASQLFLEAMERARDSNAPVATARTKLWRAKGGEAYGCIVFLPVYTNGTTLLTVEDRRLHLAGFVTAVLDLSKYVQTAFDTISAAAVDLQLLDVTVPVQPEVLGGKLSGEADSPAVHLPWKEEAGGDLQEVIRFDFAGRQWNVICRPASKFASRIDWESWAVLIGGLLLTGLFCIYLYTILSRSAQIERIVNVRTRELAETNVRLHNEIAERSRAQEAITRSEARLQAILDNSSAVIYLKDLEGKYLLVNREFETLFHVSRDKVRSKTDYDLFPKAMADAFRANDRKAIEAGEPVEFEEVAPVDGAPHTYISIKFPLFGAENKPNALCGISTDITERKAAEQALKDSEALYHSLVETLPMSVFRKDLRGRVTFGNLRYCQTLDRPVQEIIGKSDFDLFPRELAEKYVSDDQKVIESRQVFEDVEEHQTPDGKTLYVHVLKAPVLDAQGNIVGVQVMFWDVTARKRAEEELERTAADLARSNRELELFAYVASHDLQEPLRMIASYTQLLARRYKDKLDSEAEEFIEFAVDGAVRMQKLINDLLTYSRVGTRGKPFEPTHCEKVLENALTNLKIAIEESQAVITHDPLPTLRADSGQLTQLFQNLIGNAIKFRGERSPRIHLHAERRDGEWIFSVADNGIGIEPQYFERIFTIFQRLHTQREYSGTGIGLAVCKKIVERHGGRIWVESKPGHGSTFYFSLPV